jgi:hypothetical protein
MNHADGISMPNHGETRRTIAGASEGGKSFAESGCSAPGSNVSHNSRKLFAPARG